MKRLKKKDDQRFVGGGGKRRALEKQCCRVAYSSKRNKKIRWEEKSIKNPTQTIEYLGLSINTVSKKWTLPARKISGIHGLCKKALEEGTVFLREAAKILVNLNLAIRRSTTPKHTSVASSPFILQTQGKGKVI